MRAVHLSSKLHPSAYRSVTEMVNTQEMQRVDRELHLKLAESPINPAAFIHMSSPKQNGCDPLFYLKIYGEALWKWRELKMVRRNCLQARGYFKPFSNRRASLSRHSSARSGSTCLFSKAAIRSCGKCSACLFHVLILLIQAKMMRDKEVKGGKTENFIQWQN